MLFRSVTSTVVLGASVVVGAAVVVGATVVVGAAVVDGAAVDGAAASSDEHEAARRTAALNMRPGTTRARDRPWRPLFGPTSGVYMAASPSVSDVVGGAVYPVPIIPIAVNNSSTTLSGRGIG